jgi:hypothetical protein
MLNNPLRYALDITKRLPRGRGLWYLDPRFLAVGPHRSGNTFGRRLADAAMFDLSEQQINNFLDQ